MKTDIDITIVVPLRLAPKPLYDEIERIERIIESVPRDKFCILIVDYGTKEERVGELQSVKAKYSFIEIFHTGHFDVPFAIGEARDLGVQHAKTAVVMFHDIDFLAETETYYDIAAEVEYRSLKNRAYKYLLVPTIFLTDNGTVRYLAKHNRDNRRSADRDVHVQALNANQNENIAHYALGSSVLVINRYFYLMAGGHDREFQGHGAEDFEHYNRLSNLAPITARPRRYIEDIPFNSGKWEGFRAYFSLYGMELWMRGVIMVHLNHPRREKVDATYKQSSKNFALLAQRIKVFQKETKHIQPLCNPNSESRLLLLADPTSSVANALHGILPSFSYYDIFNETDFESGEYLLDYVENKKMTHVVFLNPYGNEFRFQLYSFLNRTKTEYYFKVFAFDRGALPDSWFFDDGGFLGASNSYDASKWNMPLPSERITATKNWINEYFEEGRTLEDNGPTRSEQYWREKLGAGRRKLVFVALQRPTDTATRYFAGPSKTYDNFLQDIRYIHEKIDRRKYFVFVKKHPLETERPDLGDVVYVPDDANVNDLISASEKVVTLNSGTGLIAAMLNKPVIVCGDAWYAREGIAITASSKDHLLDLLESELTANEEINIRFISYLKDIFYSFGESHYITKKKEDGSLFKICNKIIFSNIRNLHEEEISLGVTGRWINPKSFLTRGIYRTNILWKKEKQLYPKTLSYIESYAPKIYRKSRNIPILNKIVDQFVPIYKKFYDY